MRKFIVAFICLAAMFTGCYNISLNVPPESAVCQCKEGECKCCAACACKHKVVAKTPDAQTSIQKKIDETVHELAK